MQGPKLTIINDCSSCEFLNWNRDYLFCEKLSTGVTWTLERSDTTPITPLECPFLEKSITKFTADYISEIKNSHVIKMKDIIKNIFSKNEYTYDYDEFNLEFIRIRTGNITDSNTTELQKLLPDYKFEIMSNGTDVIIELSKRKVEK